METGYEQTDGPTDKHSLSYYRDASKKKAKEKTVVVSQLIACLNVSPFGQGKNIVLQPYKVIILSSFLKLLLASMFHPLTNGKKIQFYSHILFIMPSSLKLLLASMITLRPFGLGKTLTFHIVTLLKKPLLLVE